MVAAGREAARALLADGFLAQVEHGVPLTAPGAVAAAVHVEHA
jgi:hypothetical protein